MQHLYVSRPTLRIQGNEAVIGPGTLAAMLKVAANQKLQNCSAARTYVRERSRHFFLQHTLIYQPTPPPSFLLEIPILVEFLLL